MQHGFVFDLDPNIVKLGPYDIPYFGLGLGALLVVGYLVWLALAKRRQSQTKDPGARLGPNAIVYGLAVVFIAWNIRDLSSFGPLQLRYYGVIFASMLYLGFLLWKWQMTRGGHPLAVTEQFLIWGVVAVLVGSRLGHCLFYEPEKYLSDPIQILKVWQGGLASHGATIGLVVALLLFAKKHSLPWLEVLDRFSMSAAVGAAAVRLGNFFNSEIVGRATDVPWAVRFMRYDNGHVARHPSQLYEFTLGILVLLTLYITDRLAGREKRPTGLLASLFLILYFTGRFSVEFVKEYQVDLLVSSDSALTMGQYLSILPIICGVALLIWSLRRAQPQEAQTPAPIVPNATARAGATAPSSVPKNKRKKGKRKKG